MNNLLDAENQPEEKQHLTTSNKKGHSLAFFTPIVRPMRKISAENVYEKQTNFPYELGDKLPNPYFIGICGGAQSGKSLVAR